MTNKANSRLSFLRRNLKGCPKKLKQTAYFSCMEYGATVWDPYQKYNSDKVERVQRRAAWFVKSRYTRYSSVSDMLDELGWPPLSQRRQEVRLILFYKIINKCPSKTYLLRCIRALEENTRLNLDRLVIQLGSMDSLISLKLLLHGTGLLSLKLRQ